MIGVVDWGIGGLGVARAWRAHDVESRVGSPAMLYLSDTGAPPYGMLDHRALVARLRQVVAFLRGEGADAIMLACNAASTARGELTDLGEIHGVVLPTLAHVLKGPRARSMAIIGGARTIRSRVYANALRAHGIEIVQRVAQPLSAMIERGEHESAAFEHAARAVPSQAVREREADAFFTTGEPSAMKRAAVNAWGPSFSRIEPRRVAL